MATAEYEVIYEIATQDDLRAEIDRLASERLHMSGAEFLERWRVGDLDAFSPTVSRIALLARLLRGCSASQASAGW